MTLAKPLKQFRIIEIDGTIVARGVEFPSKKCVFEVLDEDALPEQIRSLNLKAVEKRHCNNSRTLQLVADNDSDRLREYYFQRNEDESGVSGTGVVTRGVEFESLTVAHEWIVTDVLSINIYDNAKQAEKTHGHNGKTLMKFVEKHGLPNVEE